MDEELADAFINDMDFDKYGKVKCRKIEEMMQKLSETTEKMNL